MTYLSSKRWIGAPDLMGHILSPKRKRKKAEERFDLS